jgi:hypothetical protein
MTGPKPPPKRALHIVRSRTSSFKWEYPLLSFRSSSSFLCIFPRLPVTVTVNGNYTPYLKTSQKSFMHKISLLFDTFLKFSLGTIDCTLNFPSDCSGRNTSWRKFRFLQLGCRRYCSGVSWCVVRASGSPRLWSYRSAFIFRVKLTILTKHKLLAERHSVVPYQTGVFKVQTFSLCPLVKSVLHLLLLSGV